MKLIITIFLFLSSIQINLLLSQVQKVDTLKSITSQKTNSTNNQNVNYDADCVDEEFNLFLFALAMCATVLTLILVGVGSILTLCFLGAIFALTTFGLLSISFIVGLQQKSIQKGFKTFMLLFCGTGGTIFGATTMWIWNKIVHWWSFKTTLFVGSIGGLIGGLLLGLLATYIVQKIGAIIKNKIEERTGQIK